MERAAHLKEAGKEMGCLIFSGQRHSGNMEVMLPVAEKVTIEVKPPGPRFLVQRPNDSRGELVMIAVIQAFPQSPPRCLDPLNDL